MCRNTVFSCHWLEPQFSQLLGGGRSLPLTCSWISLMRCAVFKDLWFSGSLLEHWRPLGNEYSPLWYYVYSLCFLQSRGTDLWKSSFLKHLLCLPVSSTAWNHLPLCLVIVTGSVLEFLSCHSPTNKYSPHLLLFGLFPLLLADNKDKQYLKCVLTLRIMKHPFTAHLLLHRFIRLPASINAVNKDRLSFYVVVSFAVTV